MADVNQVGGDNAEGAAVARIGLRVQFRAMSEMRWRMLVNSLRSQQGSFELGARVLRTAALAFLGLAAGLGLGFGAWAIAAHEPWRILTVLLWPVLFLWQMLPVLMAAFQDAGDLSVLLRFPVSFPSYVLLYLAYGLFDAGTLVGGIGVAGIWTGVTIARPQMVLWTTLVLALFAIFNLLLTRMIFAWIERWLAQRRTREVMGAIFLFALLGLQLLNPAFYHHGHRTKVSVGAVVHGMHWADRVQSTLPPGLSANAMSAAHEGKWATAAGDAGALALYMLAAGGLLCLRLRAEYRGENLGEAPVPAAANSARRRVGALGAGGAIGAILEKELRYLMRSGVMLYSLFAPLFFLLLFSGRLSGQRVGAYLLPLGAAYSFLGLTRLLYNSLGGEGAGIQIYFLAPVRFRTVMLAKNLMQLGLFAVELVLVTGIVLWRSRPGPTMIAVTAAWLLFAVPMQLAVANVLSITMAYRMTLTRLSREQGAAGSGLLSMLIQLGVLGVGAAVYMPLHAFGRDRWAAVILLVLAAGAVFAWMRTLDRVDGLAEARRERLISVLAKAA